MIRPQNLVKLAQGVGQAQGRIWRLTAVFVRARSAWVLWAALRVVRVTANHHLSREALA